MHALEWSDKRGRSIWIVWKMVNQCSKEESVIFVTLHHIPSCRTVLDASEIPLDYFTNTAAQWPHLSS